MLYHIILYYIISGGTHACFRKAHVPGETKSDLDGRWPRKRPRNSTCICELCILWNSMYTSYIIYYVHAVYAVCILYTVKKLTWCISTANIYTYTPIIYNTVYIILIRRCKHLSVVVCKFLSRSIIRESAHAERRWPVPSTVPRFLAQMRRTTYIQALSRDLVL